MLVIVFFHNLQASELTYAFAFRYIDISNWKYVSLASFFEALEGRFQVWVQLMPFLVEFPALYKESMIIGLTGDSEQYPQWRTSDLDGVRFVV